MAVSAVETVYVLIISAVVTGLVAWVKSIGGKTKAIYQGTRCILYVEIKRLYYQAKHDGYCPLYILEDTEDLYRAYKRLGGNGALDSVVQEMTRMPKTRDDAGGSQTR